MTIAIEDLITQFADNFILLHSKYKKGQKYNATHKEDTITNGVVLNILGDERTKNVRSFSEENEEEILVVTKRDIHEFKDK
jgi:hypothetical protein